MNPHPLFHSLLVASIAPLAAQNLLPPEPESTQIAWASEAFAVNLLSDGVTTFEQSGWDIRFELGTFAPGFDPLTATPEQWVSSWIVLQGTDYDLMDQQFIQTATLSSNTAPFSAGAQAWIWGYNTKNPAEGAEWVIVAATGWTFPSIDSPLPSIFSMSDALPGETLIGRVNEGGFHMQLGAVNVIPEPGVPMMMAGALLLMFKRRR